MSSPFKVFRKHQKLLLAIAGLMAIISFVILPIVLQNLGMRQSSKNPVVATTTKYGDLKQSDMAGLHARHQHVVGVLAAVTNALTGYDYQQCFRYWESPQWFGGTSEEEMVNRWLIGRKADELGINVSNDTVTSFLQDQTMNKITPEDLLAKIKQQGTDRYTEQMFYDDLRYELKVQEFMRLYQASVEAMPPAQRWDYYCRIHQQAQIQCVPVPVAQIAATIKSPDDEVLKEFYEKCKDNLPSPYSPQPGFRVPEKIEVQYFSAEIDKFAAPENITDDEIQTYYEKDAKRYDELNKNYLMKEAEKAGVKKESGEKEGEKKQTPEGEKPAEKPADGAKPADAAKPAESGAQPAPAGGEKKEGEKKDEVQTAPPAADKPADKPADVPADKPVGEMDKKSSSVERSVYHFASLAADDNKDQPPQPETPKPETPKPETPATSGDAAAPAPSASQPNPADARPADAKPAETNPAEAKPAEAKPSEPAGQAPAAGETTTPPAGAGTEKAESPKRQLTEEVRKDIREVIARDRIRDAFTKLEGIMKENAVARKSYEAAKLHGETNLKEPPQLDFAALAKEYGVTAGDTGEITLWQARDWTIGKSDLVQFGKSELLHSGQPYLAVVFDNPPRQSEIGKFSPVTSAEGGNLLFLSWKTKDLKEAASQWEDAAVKKQVLEAWKMEQVRKPALERAKKLAADATKSKATLKEAFAGVAGLEVVSPPAFAWLTGGLAPDNPRYELNWDIKDLETPGEDFMKTVFGLSPMGVGTAMNEPQTVAYVIQVEKFEPSSDVLWDNFKEDDVRRYAGAGESDLRAANIALLNELSKEAGLKWQPKADRLDKAGSSGS